MRRQSNLITPLETWLELFWSKCIFCGLTFDFVLSPVIKHKALVGVLSSSIWVLNQGRMFWARALQSLYFFMFSFTAYIWKPCNEPETSGEWTHKTTRRHFCSFPVFRIQHPLIYLIYFLWSEFFSVICLFWHTLTARDDTRTRQHTRK